MLRHSLVMKKVVIPGLSPEWPAFLDLELGLKEVLLLEGVRREEGEALTRVAATLNAPLEGEVLWWGMSRIHLPRTEFFRIRRQIAYIAPGQALLQRFNLGENIALPLSYHQGLSVSRVIEEEHDLLDKLDLRFYLPWRPPILPPEVYWRGLLARELIKRPELILVHMYGPAWNKDNLYILREFLQDYIDRDEGAVFLTGRNLEFFRHLAHRLLRVENGRLNELFLLHRREQSPVDFFPLV